ncbi:conjugal transfer protein TraF [Acetobacter estunensis]|uniref:conjugal transfer protein TraF n=1 Tax=Acetobacter estunensis TaxID=104097 RepID=UPI001C2D34F9|nr:conjugal transfer protein TraF [Acetobacter estunensis]MBV1838623.1 conjugal transfer protein TraF [Acetobacter estunensis]
MMLALVIWQVMLTALLAVLAVTLFALARQIGVLHERMAPIGPQEARSGLEVGQVVPRLVLHTLEGAPVVIGDPLAPGHFQMLLFVAPECPVCKRVIPVVRQMAAERGFELLFVGDGPEPELKTMVASRAEMQGVPLLTGVELGLVLQINRLPALVVLDEHGTIRVKDIVNTRRQIEGLLEGIAAPAPQARAQIGEISHAAV